MFLIMLPSNLHRLGPNNHTSVRMQALPRDETAVRTRQEHKASRNFTWLSWPTHRTSERLLRLIIHGSRNQRRPNRTWAHAIYSDPVLNLLIRETASESYNCSLGRSVVKKVRTADVMVYGRAGDDCVTALHLREDIFGEEKKRGGCWYQRF